MVGIMTIFFYRFAPDVFDFCNAKLVEKSTNALVENIWKPCDPFCCQWHIPPDFKTPLEPGGSIQFLRLAFEVQVSL